MDTARDIYFDNPHLNKIVTYQGKKWYHKTVDDKVIQYREFAIQKLLNKLGYVPNCINYSESGFLEEIIQGETFAEFDMVSDNMLITLSGTLQSVHKFFEENNNFHLFKRFDVSVDGYDPEHVLRLVVGDIGLNKVSNLGVDYDFIDSMTLELTNIIKKIQFKNSIIHGDVSLNNVIYTPAGSVVLIDWTDCRVDVGVSDFSQGIHLMKLSKKQRDVFLSTYDHVLNFPLFVEFQLLMHALYDLIAKIKKNKSYDYELMFLNKRIEESKTIL